MAIVVDFAWTKPTVEQLRSWGAVAVGMYVSRDPAKNATAQLIDEYAAAGIKTLLFFEDTATGPAKGYAQGKADAELAVTQAGHLGKPEWAPILAGVDFDIPDYAPHDPSPVAKLGPVAEYFKAWDETVGHAVTGCYGGYWAVTRLCAAGLASFAVQTVAWSGGLVDAKDIVALQNARTLDGGNVDVEVVEHANLLAKVAWVPGEQAPGSHPVITHGSEGPWVSKGMLPLHALAAGPLRSDIATVLATTLRHTAGTFPPVLAAYLNAGNLDQANAPAGAVVWYPKAAA